MKKQQEEDCEDDSTTQICVYTLAKRNLSLSDAGIYYCAVLACGKIVFGNGTHLEFITGKVLSPIKWLTVNISNVYLNNDSIYNYLFLL